MDPLETIRQKLAKIDALINDPAATDGEKAAAIARRFELLRKHNLSDEEVRKPLVSMHFYKLPKRRWAKRLWAQCACWLLNVPTIQILGLRDGQIGVKLSALDAADLRACYAYYCIAMEEQVSELDDEAKEAKKSLAKQLKRVQGDKDGALEALLLRYGLGHKSHFKETQFDLEKEMERRRQQKAFEGDAWERGEKLKDQQTLNLGC